MANNIKLVLKNGIRYGIAGLSLAYIGKSLFISWNGIFSIPHSSRLITHLLFFSISYAGLVFIAAFRWQGILEALSTTSFSAQSVNLYVKTNIVKYLPGNVMHIIGRNFFGKQLGWPHSHLIISQLIELVLVIGTAGILAAVFSFRELILVINYYSHPWNKDWLTSAEIIILAGGIALLCCFSELLLYRKKMIIRQKLDILIFSLFSWRVVRQCLHAMFSYSLIFLCLGFMLSNIYFGVLGIEITVRQTITVISFYAVAWVAGLVTPGLPGGLGVREGVLLLLLSPLFPQTATLQALALHRMVTVMGDLMAFVIAHTLDTIRSPSKKTPFGRISP